MKGESKSIQVDRENWRPPCKQNIIQIIEKIYRLCAYFRQVKFHSSLQWIWCVPLPLSHDIPWFLVHEIKPGREMTSMNPLTGSTESIYAKKMPHMLLTVGDWDSAQNPVPPTNNQVPGVYAVGAFGGCSDLHRFCFSITHSANRYTHMHSPCFSDASTRQVTRRWKCLNISYCAMSDEVVVLLAQVEIILMKRHGVKQILLISRKSSHPDCSTARCRFSNADERLISVGDHRIDCDIQQPLSWQNAMVDVTWMKPYMPSRWSNIIACMEMQEEYRGSSTFGSFAWNEHTANRRETDTFIIRCKNISPKYSSSPKFYVVLPLDKLKLSVQTGGGEWFRSGDVGRVDWTWLFYGCTRSNPSKPRHLSIDMSPQHLGLRNIWVAKKLS